MPEIGSLPECQKAGCVNLVENKNHHQIMEEQVEDATLFSSIQNHTRHRRCCRRRRFIAIFSLFLFLIVFILLILIVDLIYPASNRRRFEVYRVALDATGTVPAATVDVAYEHGSLLSTVEPKEVRCSVEGAGNVNVLVEEDEQEHQKNNSDDIQCYRLRITCPEQHVKSHANFMWKVATRLDNNHFSIKQVVCWIDVVVHVGGFLPVSKTVQIDGKTLAQGWNSSSSPSMEDGSPNESQQQQQQQQPPFLCVRNASVDELEVAVRVDVPAWIRSLARTVQITLPPTTVIGRIEGHGDDPGTVLRMEGLNANYVRGDVVDGGVVDSGNVAVVAVASSSSSSGGGFWFSLLLDILTSTRDHSSIDITMNANGTFFETLVGRQHRITVDFEHETQSPSPPPPNRSRHRHNRRRDLHVDNEQHSSTTAVVTTTNRQMQDMENKDLVKMDCVKVVDDSDNVGFSICWLIRLRTGFVFVGDMSVYDMNMSAVVKTNWDSNTEEEGQIKVDTVALFDVTEGDGTTTALLDVDGTTTMGMIDDDQQQLFFQSKYVNDGTWMPFQAVMNMEGAVVGEFDELTMNIAEVSFLLEGTQLMNGAGRIYADTIWNTYQVSMSDPVLEMESTLFGQTSTLETGSMTTTETTTTWNANTKFTVYGEVAWDTKMEGKTVKKTDDSGEKTTTSFRSSIVDEPNNMTSLVENKLVTGGSNVLWSHSATFTSRGVDLIKSELMYVLEFGDGRNGKLSMIAEVPVWEYETSGSVSFDKQEMLTIRLDDLFYRQGQYVYFNVDGLSTVAVDDTRYNLTMEVNCTEHDWSLEGNAVVVDNRGFAVGYRSFSLVLKYLTLHVKEELKVDVLGQFFMFIDDVPFLKGGERSWAIRTLFNDKVHDGYLSCNIITKKEITDSYHGDFSTISTDVEYVTFGLNQVPYVYVHGNCTSHLDLEFDDYNLTLALESDPTAMTQLAASTSYYHHNAWNGDDYSINDMFVEWEDISFGWKGDTLFNTDGRFRWHDDLWDSDQIIPASLHFAIDESEWLDFVSDSEVSWSLWYDNDSDGGAMLVVTWEKGLFEIGSQIFLDSTGSIEFVLPLEPSWDVVYGTMKTTSSTLAAMHMGIGMDLQWIQDELELSVLVQQMRIGWRDMMYLDTGAYKDEGGGGLAGTSRNGDDTDDTPGDDTEGEDGDFAKTPRSIGDTSGGSSWGLAMIAIFPGVAAAAIMLVLFL